LTPDISQEDGNAEAKVCNVCHLAYEGDECPVCKSERDQASAVVEDRGRRRGRRFEEYFDGADDV
jgi:hypothetical protein